VAQLRRQEDELIRRNASVLVVTFGSSPLAHAWLEETKVSFPVLLDEERRVYRAYGLERSWLRSWNLRTTWRYVQLIRAGRHWRGIQGDSTQLGGDFIVDTKGVVRLAYRSHDPTDRHPVSALLARLQELATVERR